ncbi:MAG: glycerophosphodiester phosphodiesterase [Hydrogenophaga sp.]|uniref:glycerophosphodiester phosphodiesterase n=1 Tax=Hydrogenophaga sp. TaxID=1904254 RepID=UPI00260CA6AF|nr:glycerophosphodiester phosphodiesterase [Hydrogenophaga sp.]MDM7941962.1 glycerophosphodiester phosphodiesterase [Hydrogenophaga sp.]
MNCNPPLPPQRLTWLRWGCTTALGLSMWCAGAALAFDVQGHRGARGLAPENTLAGIERALTIGVSTIEIDILLSADGVPVVYHDTTLNPDLTRDSSGRWLQARGPALNTLTAAQLAGFDVGRINPASQLARDFALQQASDGERIPTLAAVFEHVKRLKADHVRFNIELKRNPSRPQESTEPEAFVRAVLDVVNAHGMARRSNLQSFDWSLNAATRRQAPDMALAFLTIQRPRSNNLESGEWTAGLRISQHRDAPAMVAAAGGKVWSPNFNDLSQTVVQRAREESLRVIPWTVNETPDMARLIDWGVDGIITDYPDRLRAVMQERGMALPPALAAAPAKARLTQPAPTAEPVRFGVAPDVR